MVSFLFCELTKQPCDKSKERRKATQFTRTSFKSSLVRPSFNNNKQDYDKTNELLQEPEKAFTS